MKVSDLARYRRVYVCSPYTQFIQGHDAACREASLVTARLMKEGVCAFSPIAHSHTIASHSDGILDPVDHKLWMEQDQAWQEVADAVVVVKMAGWDSSQGVTIERTYAAAAHQPIYYLDPDTMELSL